MRNMALVALEGFKSEYPEAVFYVPYVGTFTRVQETYKATFEVGEADVLAWRTREEWKACKQEGKGREGKGREGKGREGRLIGC